MLIGHVKAPYGEFKNVQLFLKENGLSRDFIYHKAKGYGHFRFGIPADTQIAFSRFKVWTYESNISNEDLYRSLKTSLGFQFENPDVPPAVETLFLYDLFDLFGFPSHSLIYGRTEQRTFFSHHVLPTLPYLGDMMRNFAAENDLTFFEKMP